MNVLIVVPAFNEEKMIRNVIDDLKKHGYSNIVVIDDGSTDQTGSKAKGANVKVFRHLVNRGLGAGLGTGFEFAVQSNPDVLVTFDSDGQHQARDLKKLIEPIALGKSDVVIGSRFHDFKSIPVSRKVVNYIGNFATFALYGIWTTDSQSGLRAFSKKAYTNINLITDRMEVSNEFFREIRSKKLRFTEVPIEAIYTQYSLKGSKQGNIAIASVKIGIKMIISLFR